MKITIFVSILILLAKINLCQGPSVEESTIYNPRVTTMKLGNGNNFPKKWDTVEVHYRGFFMDNKQFDSSYDRNNTFHFKLGLGHVIKCWDFVVSKMSIGQKIQVRCPSEWAYGARGAGGLIPPNADLIFEIELLSYK